MPSHPHLPHTKSDWCLLVVMCSILQPLLLQSSPGRCFISWLWPKKLPINPTPVDCLTSVPVRPTVARTHELHSHPTSDKHIPHCNSCPQAICTCTWASWLCFTSGPLPTPRLCTSVLEQTPEAGSSCFEQPAQTVLLHITASKVPIQNDRFRILLQDS